MSQAGSVLDHPVAAGVRAAAAGLDPSGPAAVWQLSDDDVETTLATLLEVEARTVALQAALLREAEARDLTARTRAATVERWLGDRFRLSRADAAARARDAVLLGRHPMVHAALADGRVTVEQAGVTATVLDRVALLPEVSADERQEAARFLLDQGAALTPRDLARAGQAVLEALTATPSLDDPAEEAALAREQQRAEAEAQHAERDDLRIGRRRGRLRAVLDLGPIGEATVLAWPTKGGPAPPRQRRLRGHPAAERAPGRHPRGPSRPRGRHPTACGHRRRKRRRLVPHGPRRRRLRRPRR